MEPIEVYGVKMDDTETYGIEVDGIIAVSIPFIVADKFPGLQQALLKAAREWSQSRSRELSKLFD